MSYSTEEKDWLRRISNRQPGTDPHTEKQETKPIADKPKVLNKAKKKGRGFKDIAGMENLKQMVTENFINVLQNSELAKAYGIRPPSILFYGPAGCGKTFFAEKMAEEIGIHFMKVVPDDLACTWVHGTWHTAKDRRSL